MRLIICFLASFLLIGIASADHFLLGQVLCIPVSTAYLSAVNLESPNLNSGLNTTIPNGGAATLTWDSPNASSCTGTGFSTGGSAGIGSIAVSPTSGVNTYTVNCGGATASATVTVSGARRDAAATYCAAHGGGSGTTGSPWHDTCIQAAVNASSSGDTVFLAAGNWAFNFGVTATGASWASNKVTFTTSANVGVSVGDVFSTNNFSPSGYNGTWTAVAGTSCSSGCTLVASDITNPGTESVLGTVGIPAVMPAAGINLVGAGSGNTVDAYGHPNNPMWNKTGTYTRLYQSSGCSQAGGDCGNFDLGFLRFTSCTAAPSVNHLFMDGSVNSAGGDIHGLLSFRFCPGVNVNDIRAWSNGNPNVQSGETQFNIADQNGSTPLNETVQNSIFSEPPIVSGNYAGSQIFQNSSFDGFLIKNNVFYMYDANPFYVDNATFTTNLTFLGCDSLGCSGQNGGEAFGYTGSTIHGSYNGSTTGSFHNYAYNNYFNGNGDDFGTGSAINDPLSSGIENDLQWIGNWVVGGKIAIDNCEWHIYGGPGSNCYDNSVANSVANEIHGFTVRNNSMIGSTSAQLNAFSGGCNESGAGVSCGLDSNMPPQNTFLATITGYTATQNYLSSPSNQYNVDSAAVSPSVSSNFCAGTGTFTGCATTGFTNAPTAAFTLGTLSNGAVNFSTTTFTAQYGAVKWLASTSSTTPLSGDARWSFLPPISLAVTHGSTVYLWTMDSANHISAPASAVVP